MSLGDRFLLEFSYVELNENIVSTSIVIILDEMRKKDVIYEKKFCIWDPKKWHPFIWRLLFKRELRFSERLLE